MTEERVTRLARRHESIAAVAREMGINHDLQNSDFAKFYGSIETPVQLAGTAIRHDFSFGAYSYITGGFLFHTHVGRYSSISNGQHFGQGGHAIEWLSMNPFVYQPGAPFRSGPRFLDRELFEADQKCIDPKFAAELRGRLKPTRIGNDVWIAHGVFIKNGVTIGDGAVIGARSVVTKDIPPYSVAYGTPARVAKMRFPEKIVERLLAVRWWDYAPWQMRHIDLEHIEVALDQLEELRGSNEPVWTPQKLEIL